MALLFWAIMAQAGRVVEEERKELKDVSSMEKEPLAFLVAYALPVVTATAKPATGDAMAGAAALLAFVVVMAIVVWQQQLFYVNPLAAMMGCHFFSGTRESGEKVLVVSRRKVTSIKSMRVAVLSEYLWLEVDAEQ